MNSDEISRCLSHIPTFLGVFAADELYNLFPTQRTYSLVVNTAPGKSPGLHWQAIVVINGIGNFFCSFGKKPTNWIILEFCNRIGILYYNQRKCQQNYEITCGAFCVYFVIQLSEGKTIKEVVTLFRNIQWDDLLVRTFLKERFDYHLPLPADPSLSKA